MADSFLPPSFIQTDATNASIRSTAGSAVAVGNNSPSFLHDTSAGGSRGATDFQSSITADSSMMLDAEFDRGLSVNLTGNSEKWLYDPKRFSSSTDLIMGSHYPPSSKSKRALSHGTTTVTASPARIMRSSEKSSPTGGRDVAVPNLLFSGENAKPFPQPNLKHTAAGGVPAQAQAQAQYKPSQYSNYHHHQRSGSGDQSVDYFASTNSRGLASNSKLSHSSSLNPISLLQNVDLRAPASEARPEQSPSSFMGVKDSTPPVTIVSGLMATDSFGKPLSNGQTNGHSNGHTNGHNNGNTPGQTNCRTPGSTKLLSENRCQPSYNPKNQSFKSIAEYSTTFGGPQPLSASSYAKQVKLDGSNIWDHVKDYQPATLESVQSTIQKCYYEIGKAEDDSKVLFDRISQAQKEGCDLNESDFNSDYLNPQYEQLYRVQVNLVSAYVKFIRISYHPSGNASVEGLIWKYKIYQRMWSRGIFQFLELIRFRLPQSGVLINKFIGHCFVLLGLVADVGNDSASTWHEALGDLARFGFYASTRWNSSLAVASWDELAKYWYLRAATADLSNGRVLHHLALVTADMERVYYFCKGLISSNPSSINTRSLLSATVDYIFPSRGRGLFFTFRTYLRLILLGQYSSLEPSRTALIGRLSEGVYAFRSRGFKVGVETPSHASLVELSADLRPLMVDKYGAMIAYCNIAAFLAMGSYQKNDIIRVFLQKNGTAVNKQLDVSIAEPDVLGKQLSSTFEVMCAFLRLYMCLSREMSLPHMIVWFEFCYAMYNESLNFAELFGFLPSSPLHELADYLNAILVTVKSYLGLRENAPVSAATLLRSIELWTHSAPSGNIRTLSSFDLLERLNLETPGGESRRHFPYLRERPLPEDWIVWGSVWCKVLARPDLTCDKERREANNIKEYASYVNDDAYPGEIGSPQLQSVREVRLIETALYCGTKYKSSRCLYYDDQLGFLGGYPMG